MLRVKDPRKSLTFYRRLGMKLLEERHFDDFSLYFLGSSIVSDNANVKELFQPVLELTHNHGTETQADFRHSNGNEPDKPGFGHIGFLCDDVYQACDALRNAGEDAFYGFRKEPDGGSMKGLAFVYGTYNGEAGNTGPTTIVVPKNFALATGGGCSTSGARDGGGRGGLAVALVGLGLALATRRRRDQEVGL